LHGPVAGREEDGVVGDQRQHGVHVTLPAGGEPGGDQLPDFLFIIVRGRFPPPVQPVAVTRCDHVKYG
jgi:hypothetical protein